MGSSESKSQLDYNYGTITIQDNVAIKEYKVKNNQDKQQLVSRITQQKMIKVLDISEQFDFGLCGSSSVVIVHYQYHDTTLLQLIQQKQESNMPFKEQDIIKYAEQIIQHLIPTKQQVHPNEILMPNCNICDPFIFKYSDIDNKDVYNVQEYCSPELLLDRHIIDNQKSQIFSIGLILLTMCTLKSPNQANIYTDKSIDVLSLQQYWKSINPGRYSQQLSDLINQMIQIDPELRPDQLTIQARLVDASEFFSLKTLKCVTLNITDLSPEPRQSELSYNYASCIKKKQKQKTNKSACHSPSNLSISVTFSHRKPIKKSVPRSNQVTPRKQRWK